jgi:hypothetical protein
MCYHHLCADIVSWLTLIISCLVLFVAFRQFRRLIKDKKVEFTYKVYSDFFNFLNDKENKDLRLWLFGDKSALKDENKIGDLLEKIEVVYTLSKRQSIDDEVLYDLISYYIEKIFKATNPTAKDYIIKARDLERKHLRKADDLFIGCERLRDKVEQMSLNRKEPKKI